MATAALALQQAIFSTLTNDAPLVTLLSGERVYDAVPARADFPYIAFAQTTDCMNFVIRAVSVFVSLYF